MRTVRAKEFRQRARQFTIGMSDRHIIAGAQVAYDKHGQPYRTHCAVNASKTTRKVYRDYKKAYKRDKRA